MLRKLFFIEFKIFRPRDGEYISEVCRGEERERQERQRKQEEGEKRRKQAKREEEREEREGEIGQERVRDEGWARRIEGGWR